MTYIAAKRSSRNYDKVRITHIAYSMFKGNSFEQIENTWREPKNRNNICFLSEVGWRWSCVVDVTEEVAEFIGIIA